MIVFRFVAATLLAVASTALAQTPYPEPVEGDFTAHDFAFGSGETLPELRIHYRTIGMLRRGADGHASNAVLIMHGTTGSGASLLRESFADVLFRQGGLLDAAKYFIILPDAIGHGDSSKPSDGLRMKFPRYDYDDMVRAQHLLVTDGLGVDHLRLVMGTSMGGMQTWVWAYTWPRFMDAAMPLASLPVEIAGRNRMMRKLIVDAIESDPEWNGGNYQQKPEAGLRHAAAALMFGSSSPLQMQKQAPTREQAEALLDDLLDGYVSSLEPNDAIYQFEASRNYDPQSHLTKIEVPLVAVNSADDQINPPELGILEREIRKVANGQAVVLPISDETGGHGTHSIATVWQGYLADLLERSER